jgi:hypothetical protein
LGKNTGENRNGQDVKPEPNYDPIYTCGYMASVFSLGAVRNRPRSFRRNFSVDFMEADEREAGRFRFVLENEPEPADVAWLF